MYNFWIGAQFGGKHLMNLWSFFNVFPPVSLYIYANNSLFATLVPDWGKIHKGYIYINFCLQADDCKDIPYRRHFLDYVPLYTGFYNGIHTLNFVWLLPLQLSAIACCIVVITRDLI